MRNRILLLLLVGMLFSCQSENLQIYLNGQLAKHCSETLSDYSYVVIIPRRGCHSCTMEADAFFKKHRDNDKCLFIFTNLVSEKLLKIEVGYDIVNQTNVIIDKDNHFYSSHYIDSGYPLLLTRQNGDSFQYKFLLDSDGLR